ncbi:MAG: pantoate--beta-alanine ligase [Pseudomonadaceae bacterium]|nr:pantoate--beta-alanine ligase [Pseudomonadaceae bacterium]
MKVLSDLSQWQDLRRGLPSELGFVPTMGALHEGHLSLLRRSATENKISVLSIYVNPTQFNDPKDLQNYPDTLQQDLAAAEQAGVDFVLMPKYEQLYADGFRYQVTETQFSEKLCGRNRPGHFTGVLTVVMKLLNIVRPQRAYFGKKDYQQYLLVRDMVDAFFMPVDIVGCDTVREVDGLAMSSRNLNLETSARKQAARFYEIIRAPLSDAEIRCQLNDAGFQVDYVESCHGRRFAAIVTRGKNSGQTVRLIDNVAI